MERPRKRLDRSRLDITSRAKAKHAAFKAAQVEYVETDTSVPSYLREEDSQADEAPKNRRKKYCPLTHSIALKKSLGVVSVFEDAEDVKKWESQLRSSEPTERLRSKKNSLDSMVVEPEPRVESKPTYHVDDDEFDDTDSNVVSLPPIVTTINTEKMSKYFGLSAKRQFNDTYKELHQQCNQLTGGVDELIELLKNNSEGPEVANGNTINDKFIDVNDNDSVVSNLSRQQRKPKPIKVAKLPSRFNSSTSSLSSLSGHPTKLDLKSVGGDDISCCSSFVLAPRVQANSITSCNTPFASKYNIDIVMQQTNNDDDMSSVSGWDNELFSLGSNSVMKNATPLPPIDGAILEDDDDDISYLSSDDDYSTLDGGKSTYSPKLQRIDSDGALNRDIDDGISSYSCHSPRAIFLAGCLKNAVPPRSIAMLRHRNTTVLNLEHHGLGDTMGSLLATGLPSMPLIRILNLVDNNFTDVCLPALMKSVSLNKMIEELDMSDNTIGLECARALGEYIAAPECSLVNLKIKNGKITDHICSVVVQSMEVNKKIEIFDVSNNLLGKEGINSSSVLIDETGSKLGKLLVKGICPLQILNVQWNMLRQVGSLSLCKAVEKSKTLTYLDMSFNAIGLEGGTTLGGSIVHNKTLKQLHIANCNIGPEACFAICVACKENLVRVLNLDGNPIGEMGAKMVMSLAISSGGRVNCSSKGCDLTLKCQKEFLCLHDPVGIHKLNMSNPLERATMFELLNIVAENESFSIQEFQWVGSNDTVTTCELSPIDLDVSLQLNQRDKYNLRELKKLLRLVQNVKFLEQKFQKHVKGLSNQLNRIEMSQLLVDIGMADGEVSLRQATFLIRCMENDGKDIMELDNWLLYCANLAVVTKEDIYNLTHRSKMTQYGNNTSKAVYVPPLDGTITIEVIQTFRRAMQKRTVTSSQISDMQRAAAEAHDVGIMMLYGIEMVKFRIHQADKIMSLLKREFGDTVQAVAKLLPRMVSTYESACFVRVHVGNSTERRHQLKHSLGQAFNPVIGHFDGYYSLNLQLSNDRLCLMRLLEQDFTNAHRRQQQELGDISQNGDWSSFRNELLGPSFPGRITRALFAPMPTRGKLEFDFSGNDRPDRRIDSPIHDHKMIRWLRECQLLRQGKEKSAHAMFNDMIRGCKHSTSCFGYNYWLVDHGRSDIIGRYLHYKFYSQLSKRHDQYLLARKSCTKPGSVEVQPLNTKKSSKEYQLGGVGKGLGKFGNGRLGRNGSGNFEASGMTALKMKAVGATAPKEDPMVEDGVDDFGATIVEEDMFDSVVDTVVNVSPTKTPAREDNRRLNTNIIPAAHSNQFHNIAKRFGKLTRFSSLDSMVNVMGPVTTVPVHDFFCNKLATLWICARHLALLIHLYDEGRAKNSDFGSYRVELIVALFSRVVDLENFELVLMQLTPIEHACVIGRLGMLCVFNPWKPDGVVFLDFSRWEERQVAKMLIHLEISEVNRNWTFSHVHLTIESPVTPGWVLNNIWMSEEGLPHSTILIVRYSTGDGLRLKGFSPKRNIRRALLACVIIDSYFVTMYDEDSQAAIESEGYVAPKPHEAIMVEKGCVWNTPVTIKEANSLLVKNGASVTWDYHSINTRE